ncbi:Nectin-3-like protein [Frankliniella fusca]|uniref:Nectin-3-like protein n=1 Tax=Frankliniella fusca TaxID=407009 RepID=A0AAE1GYU3_9NEOP|nr:Nectin-3-like protein [Frankliniella fusca]
MTPQQQQLQLHCKHRLAVEEGKTACLENKTNRTDVRVSKTPSQFPRRSAWKLYTGVLGTRKFRTDFLQDLPTPGTGPFFDTSVPTNLTGIVGKTAYLNCRVKNLGNRTCSAERQVLGGAVEGAVLLRGGISLNPFYKLRENTETTSKINASVKWTVPSRKQRMYLCLSRTLTLCAGSARRGSDPGD